MHIEVVVDGNYVIKYVVGKTDFSPFTPRYDVFPRVLALPLAQLPHPSGSHVPPHLARNFHTRSITFESNFRNTVVQTLKPSIFLH
jgi:hypothetical protein